MKNNVFLTAELYIQKSGTRLLGVYADEFFLLLNTNKKLCFNQFVSSLLKSFPKTVIYVYFHNLSIQEGWFLINKLFESSLNFTPLLRDNKFYQIKIEIKNRLIFIRDSYLHLAYSFDNLLDLFDVTLMGIESTFEKDYFIVYGLDYFKLKINLILFSKVIKRYNSLLYNLFGFHIGNSLTLPSLAYKIFSRNFYNYNWEILTLNYEFDFRNSFFGGINEVYIPYGEDLVFLDVNSLYPSVMRKNKFGVGKPLLKFFNYCTDDFESFVEKHEGFVFCRIKCKNLHKPLIVTNYNNIQIQPLGDFFSWVSTAEIRYCWENYFDNYKFFPVKGYFYTNYEFIFQKYVDRLFFYKGQANHYNKKLIVIFKKLMNALYGRLGIKSKPREILVTSVSEWFSWLSRKINVYFYNLEEVNNFLIIEKDFEKKIGKPRFNSRVDWASLISSLARVEMQKMLDQVNVFYIDVDMIVISKKDLYLLNSSIGKKLGNLKIEGCWDEGIFLEPKIYALRKVDYYFISIKGDIFKGSGNDLKLLFLDFKCFLKDDLKENSSLFLLLQKKNIKLNYCSRNKIYSENVWSSTSPLWF